MRGVKAKRLRKLAILHDKAGHEYPHARTSSRQVLAGNMRALYQWLKGRRSMPVMVGRW